MKQGVTTNAIYGCLKFAEVEQMYEEAVSEGIICQNRKLANAKSCYDLLQNEIIQFNLEMSHDKELDETDEMKYG